MTCEDVWLGVRGLKWSGWLGAFCLSLAMSVSGTCAPWYRDALVGLEVGPTGAQFGHSATNDTRYCARWDGAEIAIQAAAAQAEYLVLWVRDGDFAYYDSKLLPKAPGLGDRDPLREAIRAASERRLPVIAYCVVQQGGHFLKAHPELEMRGVDGKPLGRFCLNSGYLEWMKQLVAEQLAYGIAGFHIDMLDQGFGPPYGCWCDSCRRQFDAEFHQPMPDRVTWDESWDRMLEFRYRSSERFERALASHIKTLRPEATVDFNYHGNPPFSFEVGQRPVQHAVTGDFVTGETGVWGFSALGVGLNAEFYRASTPGKPFQVAMQRGVRMYHDQTTRPLNDLRWELFTLLAHGAFVTTVDKTAFDGTLDPMAYGRLRDLHAEAIAKRSHFRHVPVREVGIWYSSRTRDWVGRETPGKWFGSFLGMHRACVMEHLPYGVILDENANPDTLRQYAVVCLPNVGILTDKEVGLLRRYVEEGGQLLVTGHSGQLDGMGMPLKTSKLEEMIGAIARGRLDSEDNWLRRSERPPAGTEGSYITLDREVLGGGMAQGWPMLVKGPATVYQVTGAIHAGELMKPARTVRQQDGTEGTEWPMSPGEKVGPAVLLNRVGKGQVLTLAGSPDYATASEHPVVEARQLLRDAVRYLVPRSRVRVGAPSNVEVVITEEPAARTIRVHFIAYNATPQVMPARNRPYVVPGLIEDAPMFEATVEVPEKLKGATGLNPTTVIKRQGNRVKAVIQDIHEVLVLRF